MTRLRFVVPPAGPLHIAAARVALVNHLFARQHDGRLLLRLDDLAGPVQPEPVMQDLAWIGVAWDEVARQSDRRDRYAEVFAALERDGFVYPCFESEEELRAKQTFRLRRGQSGIYDRAMLRLTDKQRRDAEAGGKRPHWRFKLSGRVLSWHDLVMGHREVTLATVSDPVVMQADGTPTPILASLVDDIDQQTTHIIRGEDSPGNTAIQLELLEVLTGRSGAVRFGHLPAEYVRSRKNGRGVPVSLRGLRQDGVDPAALASCLAPRGLRLADLRDARFDMDAVLAANRAALGDLGYAAVVDRLPPGATEAFWLAVRGKLDLLKEARGWWEVVAGTIVPPVVDGAQDLLRLAASLLPAEPWDRAVWAHWTAALQKQTGLAAERIETSLRLALTGEDQGPDLADLLPLMGRSRAVARLEIAAA
ncbi:MAG TPA: glutamate--tRNA ligase family protein [Rhodopila sp.]|uniref:glutamate--tRNA ligase n=1 Tax=Rhodopila sp. TaxID=2480087 RepID=UPI002D0C1780|nr:glutamate--tRNA ligase family protein [Rhodopila sp.]HVY14510.1 glutamate--tRNA ligase family protein [Rhodopila sp.]